MNILAVSGRIPFDITFFEGKEGKNAYAAFTIGIATGKKTPEGYPEEELYRCNAWGYPAEHLNKYFQKGDRIVFDGSVMKGQDWTDKEGVLREGQTELRVGRIDGFGSKGQDNAESTQQKAPATKPASKPTSKPAPAGKPAAKAPSKPAPKRPAAPAPKK